MAEFPKAPIKRILKKAGAKRVSDESVEALRSSLESKAKEVTKEAVESAESDRRKTVQKEDIMEVK